MKEYLELCDYLGVRPKILLFFWALGFFGCVTGSLLSSLFERDDFAFLSVLALAPHFYVGLNATGNFSQKFGKKMIGGLIAVALTFLPGMVVATLIVRCFS